MVMAVVVVSALSFPRGQQLPTTHCVLAPLALPLPLPSNLSIRQRRSQCLLLQC